MKDRSKTEFDKFDEVMGGLLSVPRSELQQKLEEEKREKAKGKKKLATSLPASSRAASSKRKP